MNMGEIFGSVNPALLFDVGSPLNHLNPFLRSLTTVRATAIHFAADRGHAEVVELLLDAGALFL